LGEVLVGTQEQLAQRGGNAIRRDEWRGIVGARIVGRTRVGRLYRGVLTVKVASSAWSNELSLLKSELIAKLRLAGHDISDLRFRVEEFTGPTKATRGGQNRSLLQTRVLPEELEASLRKVEDPNLRAAIREAASWSLSRNHPPKGV
jgi:hypothetical protein